MGVEYGTGVEQAAAGCELPTELLGAAHPLGCGCGDDVWGPPCTSAVPRKACTASRVCSAGCVRGAVGSVVGMVNACSARLGVAVPLKKRETGHTHTHMFRLPLTYILQIHMHVCVCC